MKKKVKQAAVLMTSLSLLVAGCGSGEKGGASSSPNASSSPGASTAASATPAAPAKIRMYASDHSMPPLDQNDPNILFLEQKTNTDLDLVSLPHAQYNDQLSLKFASGDFPDVYQSWSGPEADLVAAGKVLELNALIDKFGPNLKKVIPKNAWDAVSVNGKILAIPQPSTYSNSVLYVRKDWLDKLGLQVPKTSDELMNVLKAFRDKDPNGNGKKDEIPFSMREKFSWGDNIFGMWGVNNSWTESFYNNEVIIQNIHPNMKPALSFIKSMVDEKVMDSEFLTNSRTVWEQKIKSGLVGMWSHTQQLAWQWQVDLDKTIPNEKPDVVAIPTPRGAGYDGPLGTRWSPIAKTFIIMKSAKNPEAIIKFFDWLVTEEGQLFSDLGQEGNAYKKENGKIVIDTAKMEKQASFTNIFKIHDLNEAVEEAKLSNPAAYAKVKAARDIGLKEGFVNESVGMPSVKNNYDIANQFLEAGSKIVLGREPLTHFDDFVKTWRKQGGDEMVKERTDWYNKNRKK
ncbi:extracellular solute-binding protein [Paenibacillus koleovorans]|uniref:extracellular solute-binding protein n=1 Tax=Paenibacillus koleovorans TaxID=121608 RepID=UPI000FD70D6E|nr:extracellular solute-binding protein [Paenibacillus koleovorans]